MKYVLNYYYIHTHFTNFKGKILIRPYSSITMPKCTFWPIVEINVSKEVRTIV